MALRSIVKLSNVNNLTDARYGAGMGVTFMGFSMKSGDPNVKSPVEFEAITGWLSGVEFVGEFDYENPSEIIEKAALYGLSAVEVAKTENIKALKDAGLVVFLKSDLADLLKYSAQQLKLCDYLVVTNSVEISPVETEHDLKHLNSICPVLLAFNLNAQEALSLIDRNSISGISPEGGNEIRPGYKDFDELAALLEPLEVED
jgi:phosphoribosylanthranilate isomerase